MTASLDAAIQFHREGNLERAATLYGEILEQQPECARAWYHWGLIHLQRKAPQLAEPLFRKALTIQPDYTEAHYNLGNALLDLKRVDESIAQFRRALTTNPWSYQALNGLGNALVASGQLAEALTCLRKALEINPQGVDILNDLGTLLVSLDQAEEAITLYRRAMKIMPQAAEIHANLAIVLHWKGQWAEAQAAYAEALHLAPEKGKYHYNFAESKRFGADDAYVATLQETKSRLAFLPLEDQGYFHFALAKVLTDLGRNEESFDHLLAGNRLVRQLISYDEPAMVNFFARIQSVFTPDLMAEKKGRGSCSAAPIFILGMPRSGSTLVEQILSSHPQVVSIGERPELDKVLANRIRERSGGERVGQNHFPECMPEWSERELRSAGEAYLAAVKKLTGSRGDATIIDKFPFNFHHIGLIHLLLPEARIIHTHRDPLDTCLSCFAKLFTDHLPFAFELGELGRYYRAYDQLMEHWRRVLPSGVMLEVVYEDLVRDFEGSARRILGHAGLEWNDDCRTFYQNNRLIRTASSVQVRQPLYQSSIGRWRPKEELLQPLLNGLGMDLSRRSMNKY